MGRLEDAILELQEARRVLSELVRANPEVDEYQKLLASVCMRLGQYLKETKAPEQALGPLTESLEAFERLLGKNLGDPYVSSYSATLGNLAQLLEHLGRTTKRTRHSGARRIFSRSLADAIRRIC